MMVCAEANPKIIAYQLRVSRASRRVVFVAQTLAGLSQEEKVQIVNRASCVSGLQKDSICVEESADLVKAPSGKIKLVVEER